MSAQAHDRITIDPDNMDGQPCIRGRRFPVVTVLRMVAGGMSVDDIVGEHPDLQPEDIPAALNYAAEAGLFGASGHQRSRQNSSRSRPGCCAVE